MTSGIIPAAPTSLQAYFQIIAPAKAATKH